MLCLAEFARGVSGLANSDHDAAFGHLSRMFDPTDDSHHAVISSWAILDLAEAGRGGGSVDDARAALERVAWFATSTQSPVARVGVACARALLADDDRAESLFTDALTSDLDDWPFFRARVRLAYGAWLRRCRRVVDSRVPLRAARDAFDALGAAPWGSRARHELRASGEVSRRPESRVVDQMTPQELQIAQMAAQGLSNREIATRLFLSHRTVGSHLYRLFPKLGISSRSQLGGVLGAASAEHRASDEARDERE